jgi:hypothetical protein
LSERGGRVGARSFRGGSRASDGRDCTRCVYGARVTRLASDRSRSATRQVAVPCRGPSHRPTTYFFSLPSNKVELWAYLESERYFHGVLREFYRERNVVMEERRRGAESQPIGRLIEQFIATSYTAHPYGQPVVGYMSDLQ